MLTLALALALAQTPDHWLHRQPNLPRGPGYAFFEAFPLSGAGTTTACSTTAPTGAKGETLTFTRTGNATCSKKGLATTGIADGDLVVVSGNVARVEPDSDSVLGLRVEGSRQNVAVRSEEIDNASWVAFGEAGGTAASKGTANSGTAPDGTATADPVTFAATTATQGSFIYQSLGVLSSTAADTVFAKSTSGGCTIDVCEERAGLNSCTSCVISDSTWTRCQHLSTDAVAGARFLIIGNVSSRNGGTARSACTAYVWGAQSERSAAYATSYIPTVAAAVTRNADGPLTLASLALSPPWCMGATVSGVSSASLSFGERGVVEYADAWGLGARTNNQGSITRAGVGSVSSGTLAAPLARYSFSRNTGDTTVTVCTNSSCSAATSLAGATAASGTIQIGEASNTFSQPLTEGIVSRVKVDLSEAGCR